jgi:hypothetical protein
MISNNDFALIAALDLNPIKTKLMHKESGEGWPLERASAIETEYRRFLYLMKVFPQVQTAPLVDVDTFWHYHILDTMKYARDCEQAFGYFLHHYPYLGMAGENGVEMKQQAGEHMRELYESTFGVSYVRPLRTDGAPEAADVQTAWTPDMGEAANSAWCVSPGIVKAADVQSAWCVSPGIIKASDVQSAWCVSPGIVKAADVQSAWCVSPGIVKAADVQTAWCVSPGIVKAADVQTAWCVSPGIIKAADVQTAWCVSPGVVKAADVQTAWCVSPGMPQAA